MLTSSLVELLEGLTAKRSTRTRIDAQKKYICGRLLNEFTDHIPINGYDITPSHRWQRE